MGLRSVRGGAALLPLLLASACGGGGTPGIQTPPTVTTPVVTAPVTTPPVTTTPVTTTPSGAGNTTPPGTLLSGANYTIEYQNSTGLVQANALSAYDAGYTGKGVTAAIIDGGIDTANPEFAGRISAASADVAGNGTINDEGGHGTAVAAVLGAAKNGSVIEGIAYDATLLVVRTDTPGTCAKECKHDDVNIAAGVDIAVANRARVINISLGGEAAGDVLVNAIDRATAAGIVVVIAAGNDSTANPDPFALVANNDAVARGLVIIAGATGTNGQIASFSDLAGSGSTHYLAALGDSLRTYGLANRQYLYTGTSFSAPLIAGAVALLAQAFPTLTGAQIVQLLYDSAYDAGATGIDATYGRGVLDLAGAFKPRGTTSLAGTQIAVSTSDNGITSAPMGDAGAHAPAGARAVILDGFGRAYGLTLGETLRQAAPTLKLAPELGAERRTLSGVTPDGNTVMALTIARDGAAARIAPLALDARDAAAARATAGFVATRLDARTSAAFGFATSGAALATRLAGEAELPFLVADRAGAVAGFDARTGRSIALRRAFGRLALAVTAETGDALVARAPGAAPSARDAYGYAQAGIAAERRVGPLTLRAGLSRLDEHGTVLGARFGTAFGGGGAATEFADLGAALAPGGGWRLDARWQRGWTRGDAGGAVARSRFATGAYSIDLTKAGVFGGGDLLALRVAQPLRVAHGGFALTLPTGYDYQDGVTATTLERLDLAPAGRERDIEAAWQRPLAGGWLTANLYWRRDPGNIAALPDDRGLALRFTLGL